MSLGVSASSRYQLEVVDKEGILIYRQGREDLILRVQYRLKALGKTAKVAPISLQPDKTKQDETKPDEAKQDTLKPPTADVGALAWVVPVPSLPRSYGKVDQKAFQQLYDLLHTPVNGGGSSFGGGGFDGRAAPAAKSVVGYLAVTVGDYTIQPVRGIGPEALRGLKDWFTRNEFDPLPDESLAFYARSGWTFLAVRLNVKDAKCCTSGTLPALRISFRSARPWFPLKLARSPHMSARIFVLLDYKIPNAPQALLPFGFQLQGAQTVTRGALSQDLSALWNESALAGAPDAYLYEYHAAGIQPDNWPSEVALPGPPLFTGQ